MNWIRHICLAITLLAGATTQAQEERALSFDAQLQRGQNSIEAAIAQARAQAAAAAGKKDAPQLPGMMQGGAGIDVGSLAEKYKEMGVGKKPAGTTLLIFVSTSMPKQALDQIGRQAAKAGGLMVLRGLRGQLGTKSAMADTMKYLEGAARAGASIQIDPQLFKRHNVQVVPTYVLSSESGEGCGEDSCEADASAMIGDVTLEYALEQWVQAGGIYASRAQPFLTALRKGQ